MKNNIAELVFIQDRNGTISGLESDTIGCFNRRIVVEMDYYFFVTDDGKLGWNGKLYFW